MMRQFLRVLKQIITTVGLKTRETYSLPILEARSLLSRYHQGCVPSQGFRSGLASQFLRLLATLAIARLVGTPLQSLPPLLPDILLLCLFVSLPLLVKKPVMLD